MTNLDPREGNAESDGLSHTPQIVPRRVGVSKLQEAGAKQCKERCSHRHALDTFARHSIEQGDDHLLQNGTWKRQTQRTRCLTDGVTQRQGWGSGHSPYVPASGQATSVKRVQGDKSRKLPQQDGMFLGRRPALVYAMLWSSRRVGDSEAPNVSSCDSEVINRQDSDPWGNQTQQEGCQIGANAQH